MSRSDPSRLSGLVPAFDGERAHAVSECDGMRRTRLRTDGLRIKTELGSKRTVTLNYPPGSWGFLRHHIYVAETERRALRFVQESQMAGCWEYFTVPISHILRTNNCTSLVPTSTLEYDLIQTFTTTYGICPFCCFPVPTPSLLPPRSLPVSSAEESPAAAEDSEPTIEEQQDIIETIPTRTGDAILIVPLASRSKRRRTRRQLLKIGRSDIVFSTAVYHPPPIPYDYQVEVFTAKLFYRSAIWEPYTMVPIPIELSTLANSSDRISRYTIRKSTQFLAQCGYIPLPSPARSISSHENPVGSSYSVAHSLWTE